MQEERIKNLVDEWRRKSHQEGDPFSSFVFVWFAFNAWLEHLSSAETDKDMIKELRDKSLNMNELVQAYDETFNSEDRYFLGSIRALVGKSKEDPIRDVRGIYPDIVVSNENDFENIVRVIYRIRCNLFHGGKDANDQRDQVLVGHAGMILRQWMGTLVKKWNM